MTTPLPTSKRSGTLFAWVVCGLAAIFYCYEYYLRIAPGVMTRELMEAYNTNATVLGSMTAFYYYAYTPMQLFVGLLLDKFSVRKLISFACFICAVGSYIFAASSNIILGDIGRFLVGLGSAFAFVGVLKLATIWLPPNRFGFIVGLATTLGTLGGMTGIILMTRVVHHFGWRTTTNFFAIIGLVLTAVLYLVIRDEKHARPDQLNTSLNVMSVKTLVQGIGRLLLNPVIWINGLIGCILYLPSTAFAELWGVPFMQSVYNLDKHQASFCVSILFLGYAISSPLVGFLSDVFNRRKIIMLISAVCCTVCISLIVFFPELMNHTRLLILMFCFGFSYGGQVLVFAVACDVALTSLAGSAIATTNMFTMIGGVVFQPLIGYILDRNWQGGMLNGVRVYSAHNYQMAMTSLPITIGCAVILCLLLKETCQAAIKK